MDCTSTVQICLGEKRGEKGQELIQIVIPMSGSRKLYVALCIGGYPYTDLRAEMFCPYICAAEIESCQRALPADTFARMLFVFRLAKAVRTSLVIPGLFPTAFKDRMQVGSKGEVASAQEMALKTGMCLWGLNEMANMAMGTLL